MSDSITKRLARMMLDAGYRQKTSPDRGWGPATTWRDANDEFVPYPPGYITRVKGTDGKGNPCVQINVKTADGAWRMWRSYEPDAEKRAAEAQKEEIQKCVDGTVEEGDDGCYRQSLPLIKLVAAEFADVDFAGVPT